MGDSEIIIETRSLKIITLITFFSRPHKDAPAFLNIINSSQLLIGMYSYGNIIYTGMISIT